MLYMRMSQKHPPCPLHDRHSRVQVLYYHCRHSPKMYVPVMQHFLTLQVADAPKRLL